jgi:hypothetical protein
MRFASFSTIILASGIIGYGFLPAHGEDDPKAFSRANPDQLKWGPLGDGVEFAVIHGDPAKAGATYVVQVKFPPYTFDYPHYHPEDRNVTVLKGT